MICADIMYACYDDDAFGGHMLIDTRHFRPVIHLQNVNPKEADSQIHVFLKAADVEVCQVPFPKQKSIEQ